MLKYLALILLIINITLWGWSKGWFGEDPSLKGRDPQRVFTQIAPQAVHIVPRETLALQNAPAQNPPSSPFGPANSSNLAQTTQQSCVETEPLNNTQASLLQNLLVESSIPDHAWGMHVISESTSWLIYLGPFESDQAASNKKAELARANIESELISNRTEYQPGLTLGFFRNESNALSRLNALHSLNITEARIIPWTFRPVGQVLRLEQTTLAQRQTLERLLIQVNIPTLRSCQSAS